VASEWLAEFFGQHTLFLALENLQGLQWNCLSLEVNEAGLRMDSGVVHFHRAFHSYAPRWDKLDSFILPRSQGT
jgi:hypothetical protein